MVFKVVIRHGEDGFYVANCPALKSCWSQGRSREEALDNIREAIDLYLESKPSDIMPSATQEVVELVL